MATTKSKAAPATDPIQPKGFAAVQAWCGRNWSYFLAFFIPVVLIYIAYAIFGIYPFGERSVLCLDLNGQYVYYFEALYDAFHGDGSALYNWSRNLSGGYMGVIGYYLASPFTLIVMLLPRTMLLGSLLIMILCKLGAASLTFCYYLQKSKGLKPLPAVMFGIMFGMCAYGIIQTIDPMWLDGLVFLPLICLGVEYLVDDGRKINYIIPLAIMMFANFYIGYMCCIFTAFYFLYYICFGSDKMKYTASSIAKTIGRMALATGVALCCAAFMILPVYNALSLGKFDFTTPDYTFKTQFEPLEFLAQFCVNQYDTVDVMGEPEVYCGVLALVFLPLFYCNNRIPLRKKIGYSFLLAVMCLSMYIRPIDMLWHGGQMPNWLPYRYSFILSFVVLCMAAMTFRYMTNIKKIALPITFGAILVLMLLIDSKDYVNKKGVVYLDTFGSIWLTIIFAGIYLLFIYAMSKKNVSKKTATWLMIGLLACVCGEETYNAVCEFKDIHTDVVYSTRKSYRMYVQSGRELVDRLYEEDPSLYRCEKTYVRTVNDNAGFGLRGLTHSSSVMNTKTLKFIEAMGYSCRSYYSRYDGNTPLADSLLGIKYVLDKGDNHTNLQKNGVDGVDSVVAYNLKFSDTCYSQSETEINVGVYENPNALSMGYMVDDDILRINAFGNDNPFNSQNLLMSTITGNTTFTEGGGFEDWSEYYYPIPLTQELRLNNVKADPYGNQTNYHVIDRANQANLDATVDIFFEATSSDPIYLFFKTENESRVNLWLADQWNLDEPTCKNVDGSDAKSLGSYFETDQYHILYVGRFEKGQQLQLRMTLLSDANNSKEKYAIVKNFFFYHFDETLFQQDINTLKDQQWELTSYSGRTLEGKITAKEGQIMMTSIPYEPGWTVWVDGQKVEHRELFQAMIGVELSAGEHTVKMSYTPPGLNVGLFLLVCGIACIVMFYFYDRQHNEMLILIHENRKKGIYSIPVPEDPEPVETPKVVKVGGTSDSSETGEKSVVSVADEILKLKKLADEGIITQEEFEAQKKKLLDR